MKISLYLSFLLLSFSSSAAAGQFLTGPEAEAMFNGIAITGSPTVVEAGSRSGDDHEYLKSLAQNLMAQNKAKIKQREYAEKWVGSSVVENNAYLCSKILKIRAGRVDHGLQHDPNFVKFLVGSEWTPMVFNHYAGLVHVYVCYSK